MNAPIYSEEAEASVVGSMMLSRKAIDAVAGELEPEDFYSLNLGVIYRVALSLHLRGEAVDAITIVAALEEAGKLEEAGGKAKMHELAYGVTAFSNAGHHARIVRKHAEQRKALALLSEATEAAQSGDLTLMTQVLQEGGKSDETGLQIIPIARALVDLEEEVKNPPELIGVEAPFSFLKPFVGGRMDILGGYQGEGKTAMYGQFVQYAATKGHKVGCFTLEMTWKDLRDRFVCSLGVPYEMLQERKFTTDYAYDSYVRAMTEAAKWQVEIIDKPGLTVADIARVQKIQEYDFILIDHLHRFDWVDRRDIERIVGGIVNIAKEYNVPVVLLAQLKRPFGSDKAPRPTMSMLRESGMIEAEAARVMFVYRPRNEMGLRHSEAELVIAKSRYGIEAVHSLIFLGEQTRFVEPI